ncbi:hypothetical protein ACTOJ1_000828 [Shigella flexneri]
MKCKHWFLSLFAKKEKTEEELFEIALRKLSHFSSYMNLQFTLMGYQIAILDYRECRDELLSIRSKMNDKCQKKNLENLIARLNVMNKRGFR